MATTQTFGEVHKAHWEEVVARKRAAQKAAIESFETLHLAGKAINEERICQLDHSDLSKRLSKGDVSAEEVVLAYIKKAIDVHKKTNCLTEILFEDAVQRAKELDTYRRQNGQVFGSLHGIPMSVKDQFNVRGYDTTLGYVGRAHQPAEEDASLVQILLKEGAVIIAKTNLPQSIMMAETTNPLWGVTTNPRDPAFTPGGSSGGESALLALNGSLVGWGTDLGGSIRSPAHMTGLYGFKPSHGRLPYYNVPVSTEGQDHVPSVVGPLARSLESIIKVTRTVIDAKPWTLDPRCIRMPWSTEAFDEALGRPLTIGIIWDDGVVRVHPPITRSLEMVSAKLKEAGHEVVDWAPDGHYDCIKVQDAYYNADGGEDIRRDVAAGGEPMLPYVKAMLDRSPAISVYEYWQLHRRRLSCQKNYLDRWETTRAPGSGRKIDVLLSPVAAHSAVPHNTVRYPAYTKVWNFLDYPALSFPVSHVMKDIDQPDPDYEPRNEMDEYNWKLYDPAAMDGHPIGLQVVGQRHEEEKVLAAAQVIENVLKGAE
ncbi:amidase domain-containing protein [Sarocladium implicatum]|nr:amidase domain-containing protein [Sarocladium implicatum]